jgi:hypothetical protein
MYWNLFTAKTQWKHAFPLYLPPKAKFIAESMDSEDYYKWKQEEKQIFQTPSHTVEH